MESPKKMLLQAQVFIAESKPSYDEHQQFNVVRKTKSAQGIDIKWPEK